MDSLNWALEARRQGILQHGNLSRRLTSVLAPRLEADCILDAHVGCVNRLAFNQSGTFLASVSDDQTCVIWNVGRRSPALTVRTGHTANIFGVRFVPHTNDRVLATGGMDGKVILHELDRPGEPCIWRCHTRRVKEVEVAHDGSVVWSCAEDGRIRQFDVREKHACSRDGQCNSTNFIKASMSFKSLSAHGCYILAGGGVSGVRMYDRRMVAGEPTAACRTWQPVTTNSQSVTYVEFSPDGSEGLANFSGDQVYVFSILGDDSVEMHTKGPPSGPTYATRWGTRAPRVDNADDVAGVKSAGNRAYKDGKYTTAIDQYTTAIHDARRGFGTGLDVLHSNRAAAFLKRNANGDDYAALRDCEQALRLNDSLVKAHYRRLQALKAIDLKVASEEAQKVVARFPGVKDLAAIADEIASEDPEKAARKVMPRGYTDRYVGRCNVSTDIKEASFWGDCILAGSDDGRFFVFDRATGSILNSFSADENVVNCVQSHPDLHLIATSGIDSTVKTWTPTKGASDVSEVVDMDLDEVVARNNEDEDSAIPIELLHAFMASIGGV